MIIIDKTKITLDYHNGYSPEDLENISISDISKYLGDPIKIEEGVTFGRIFDICIMNRDIFNTIFYSFTRGYNIDMFIDDYVNEVEDDDHVSAIDYLHVYRTYEHMIFDDGTVDHSYSYGFGGVGKADEHGVINYGVGFTSLSKLKDLPIKTDNELDITVDTGKSFDEVETLEEKYVLVHKADIPITLFNFIGAILFEISFHGTPKDRNDFADNLTETARQVESGEMETYEMLKDEDGKYYFLDDDGNKEYYLDESK